METPDEIIVTCTCAQGGEEVSGDGQAKHSNAQAWQRHLPLTEHRGTGPRDRKAGIVPFGCFCRLGLNAQPLTRCGTANSKGEEKAERRQLASFQAWSPRLRPST
eukprot:3179470-Pleurochrysis_carterae.AAC.1